MKEVGRRHFHNPPANEFGVAAIVWHGPILLGHHENYGGFKNGRSHSRLLSRVILPQGRSGIHLPYKKRRRTFSAIRDTVSSTGNDATKLIEPTEKTPPPLGVSKRHMSAPPSSGLIPLASLRILLG